MSKTALYWIAKKVLVKQNKQNLTPKHNETEFLFDNQFINEFKATLNCAEFIKRAGITHKVTLPLICFSTTLWWLLSIAAERIHLTTEPN